MMNRIYSAAVTGLATALIVAGSMTKWTTKDALEIAIVSAVATGFSILAYVGLSEPKKSAKGKKKQSVRRYVPNYCPIVTLDKESWGGKVA